VSSEPVRAEWLNTSQLKSTAARRFAEFCQQNFAATSNQAQFDAALYQEAAKLVIERLEQKASTSGDQG
jgi:acyl-homoserine lactone acylase PvdQ